MVINSTPTIWDRIFVGNEIGNRISSSESVWNLVNFIINGSNSLQLNEKYPLRESKMQILCILLIHAVIDKIEKTNQKIASEMSF